MSNSNAGPGIQGLLADYLLRNDLRDSTAEFYCRVVNVFCKWLGCDVPVSDLDARLLSEFLRAKQTAGLSSYYRRSLRSGLVAILGKMIDSRDVRSVKLTPLDHQSWTAADVGKLIAAVDCLPEKKREPLRLLIQVAYYTGLAEIDLRRLTKSHIDAAGTVRIRRSKTGEESVTRIPIDLLKRLPGGSGPFFPLATSGEMFRRDFRRVVAAAGLTGTFKTLRRSSGTAAELLTGKGHEHLANSRKIFERHYLDRRHVERKPTELPPPELGGKAG